MDGFTNAAQDRMNQLYRPTPHEFMSLLNFWSVLLLLPCTFYRLPAAAEAAAESWGLPLEGSGWAAIDFLQRQPEALWDMLLFCVAGAAGQNFIFTSLQRYGASEPLSLEHTAGRDLGRILCTRLFEAAIAPRAPMLACSCLPHSATPSRACARREPGERDDHNHPKVSDHPHLEHSVRPHALSHAVVRLRSGLRGSACQAGAQPAWGRRRGDSAQEERVRLRQQTGGAQIGRCQQ